MLPARHQAASLLSGLTAVAHAAEGAAAQLYHSGMGCDSPCGGCTSCAASACSSAPQVQGTVCRVPDAGMWAPRAGVRGCQRGMGQPNLEVQARSRGKRLVSAGGKGACQMLTKPP